MRRFWAFLVMLLTILVAVVFNVQSVYARNNYGVFYNGGTELVFEATQREDGISLNEEDIADKVQARLNTAGARDADVKVFLEKNAYVNENGDINQNPSASIRITLNSDSVINNIRTVLSGNSPLSFSDANDNVIDGKTVFGDLDPMQIINNGSSIAPAFNIANTTEFQKLIDSAKTASDEKLQKNIYVWQNKAETDNYANGIGENKRADVAKKVIATLSADNFVAATETTNAYITLTTDAEGNQFTIASAHAFVNARNAEDYGFDISYLYDNPISGVSNDRNATVTLIISGVALAVIWAVLIYVYRFSGVFGGLSIAVSLLFSFYVANVLGFEFTPITILAGFVSVVLSLMIIINYFERVKGELKKGKSIDKANYDGYRKSFSFTLFSSLFTLILALTTFLLGQGEIKVFAGFLLIASLSDFIFVNYITKWLVYWLTTSSVLAKGERAFGLGSKEENEAKPVKEEKQVISANKIKSRTIIASVIIGVTALASLGYFLGVGLSRGTGAYYNYSGDYADTTRLNISYVTGTELDHNHTFDDFESFLDYASNNENNSAYYESGRTVFFTEEDMVSPESYTFSRLDTLDENGGSNYTYYISVELKNPLSEDKLDALRNDFAGGTSLNMIASANSGYTKVSQADSTLGNAGKVTYYYYLAAGLIPVFIFALYLIVYGLYAALAMLGVSSLTFGLGTLLFTLAQLPFTSLTFFGVMVPLFILNIVSASLFTYFREEKRDAKIKNPSIESRAMMMDKARKSSFFLISAAHALGVIIGIVLIIISPSQLLSAGLITVILSILNWFLTLYLLPYLYLFTVRSIHLRPLSEKAKARRAKRLAESNSEPHETIVPGIND